MAISGTPKTTKIVDALVAALETIQAGDGYSMTPDVVTPAPPPATQYLPNHMDKNYVILVDGNVRTVVEGTTGQVTKTLVVHVAGFRRYDPEYTDPIDRKLSGRDLVDPYELEGQIEHDVEKVILTEASTQAGGDLLGGLVDNLEIVSANRIVTNQYNLPGWVGMEFRLEMLFDMTIGDPTQ